MYPRDITFDEWFKEKFKNQDWLHPDLKKAAYRRYKECWEAAQKNTPMCPECKS